jgi:hypothetical protein
MDLLAQIQLDKAAYYQAAEFGELLTHAGGSLQCLRGEEWIEAGGDQAGVSTLTPTAMIHKTDWPAVAVGDTFDVDTTTYTIRDIQTQGTTGDVLLVLSI